jgi:hypothetical protein
MSDFLAVLLIAYVQCGLLLAWYLFYRRVVALRADFGAGLAARETLLRELAGEVASLRQQMRDLVESRPRRSFQRESQVLLQAKRRGALEMARRGMSAHHIAETLNLRRTEVEMLLRLEQLQRQAQPQPVQREPNWLEAAS